MTPRHPVCWHIHFCAKIWHEGVKRILNDICAETSDRPQPEENMAQFDDSKELKAGADMTAIHIVMVIPRFLVDNWLMLTHISGLRFYIMRAANDTFSSIFITKFDVFGSMFLEVVFYGLIMSEVMSWCRAWDKPPHQTKIVQFDSLSELKSGNLRAVIHPWQ